MASARTGIAHQPPGKTVIEYLLLEQVDVKAWVVDVSSRIVLTQTFYNPSNGPTGQAKYVFPLPATAAVCAFELELEDGSVVIGQVKNKDDAEHTFTAALNQGQTAALVERVTDDIFTISVGSVPATSRVTAHLTFVMDLLEEGARDHVRLQLPMHIAKRYGTPPAAMQDASAADARTHVHIRVDIQTSGEIYRVHSSTHAIKRRRCKGRSGRKTNRHMSAIWQSSDLLASDFVITVHAEGLDKPRCFAELRDDGSEGSTVAMQLTLVPTFLAPKGNSIDTAKGTLTMLLRLLPQTETTFNVFSFDSQVSSLWQSSQRLDQTTLVEATAHVESINIDSCGTDIPKALQAAFASRGVNRDAAVFLLTDGQIYPDYQLDPFTVISNAIQNSTPQASVRLFVLGIGIGVSSDMCNRLAEHGNGEYLYADSPEYILTRYAQLLNAGRSKNVESIDIDWGLGASSPSGSSLSSPNWSSPPPGVLPLAPPPPVQQAPRVLSKISSGIRFTVFAIISSRTVPRSIKLSTRVQGDTQPREWHVEVTKVKPFAHDDSDTRMVHTLAARKLIMALERDDGLLPTPAEGNALLESKEDLRKAGVTRLGLTYQLVSKHTSFIAIRQGDERTRPRGRRNGAWGRPRLWRTSRATFDDDDDEGGPTEEPRGFLDSVASFITAVFGFLGGSTGSTHTAAAHPPPQHRPQFPGAYEESDQASTGAGGQGRGRRPAASPPGSHTSASRSASRDSTATFSTLSSFGQGSSCSACGTPPRSPSPVAPRPPSPAFQVVRGAHPAPTGSAPSPIPPQVHQLAREMALDGAFAATPLLTRLVPAAVLGRAARLQGVDERVWTTAVAVAYMGPYLDERAPDLLALLSDKARAFAEAQGTGTAQFDVLVRHAAALLGT